MTARNLRAHDPHALGLEARVVPQHTRRITQLPSPTALWPTPNKILLYFPGQSPQAKACVRRGFLPSKSEEWNLWLQLWEMARKQTKGSGYVNSHSCSLLQSPDPALQHPRGAHPSVCAHSTARGQRCSPAGKMQLSSPALHEPCCLYFPTAQLLWALK